MKSFMVYFTLQLKRVMKIFPTILFTGVLLCSVLVLSVTAIMRAESESDKMLKVKVGLVGEIDDYMGLDVEALLRVLSSKFGAEFVTMSEEEAKKQLHDGKMSAYVLIPDNLVDTIISGANDTPITYVASEGQKGISGIVMDEVVGVISELITCPQSSIFGMQNYLKDSGKTDRFWEATDELNMIYIGALADIYNVGETEITGMANRVSSGGYYLCSILVIFLLLCGLNCGSLFARRKPELCKLLISKGQRVGNQVLGEYLAYFLMVFVFFGIVVIVVYLLNSMGMMSVKEIENIDAGEYVLFALGLVPVVAVISALQFMLYEFLDNIVSGILVQFLLAVAMGYVAGCYYPLSFFPKALQIIGEITPAGVALSYADKSLIQADTGRELVMLLLYFVVFLVLAVWGRKRRVENEAGL